MDLSNVWNMFVLISLQIPGTMLNIIEYDNSLSIKGDHQMHISIINTEDAIRKASLSSLIATSMQSSLAVTSLASSTPASAAKLSSSKGEPANDIATDNVGNHNVTKVVALTSNHVTLTGDRTRDTIADIFTETSVNYQIGIENPHTTTDIQHIPKSRHTDQEHDSQSNIFSSLAEVPEHDTKRPSITIQPLRNNLVLESALIKERKATMSNVNSYPQTHNLPKYYLASEIRSTKKVRGIDVAHVVGFTPKSIYSTESTTAIINTVNSDNRTISHKNNTRSALSNGPSESAAFTTNANVIYSAKRDTLLSSPIKHLSSVADIYLKEDKVALVQESENVIQTRFFIKSNISSATASDSKAASHTTITTSQGYEKVPKTTTTMSSKATQLAATSIASTSAKVLLGTTESPTTTSKPEKKTTRRRPIATTTLKPPPTIDDYQTVTSQAGTHAYLPCNVKQLVKKPISWLRVRDGHILTVDQTTFIADQRFQSVFTVNPERWSLQIKYVQLRDAGIYECQVSTEPKASAIVYLHVVEPKTELIGAPTRHVKAGSQVKLLCIISQALEPPLFINWFYNQKQIYLNNRNGWRTEIERIELPPDTTTTTTTTTSTTTTTTAAAVTTTPAASANSSSSSSSAAPTTSTTASGNDRNSLISESEVSATHVFTSPATQSFTDDNLVELMSEPTFQQNLIQPEAVPSILTTSKTQISSTSTAGAATTSMLSASPTTTADHIMTTTTIFDDEETSNPTITVTATTTRESMAAATHSGYMMLSTLMTVADVKQITAASLIIPSVQKQDSGNYTCSPSNSEPRTVILHVLNGEYSASAITSGVKGVEDQLKVLIFNIVAIFYTQLSLASCRFFIKSHVIRRYNGG